MVGVNDIPVDVIMSWPRPNYKNPETRGNSFIVINTIVLSVAAFFVAVRIYSRVIIRPWFGLDDIFVLLAFVRHPSPYHLDNEANLET
jgi:hypothetical protein